MPFLDAAAPAVDATVVDGLVVHATGTAGSLPRDEAAARPGATCARPGCAGAASASLSFSYLEQVAVLDPLEGDPPPQAYALCATHAARTRPPNGWELCDRRSVGGSPPG